MESNRRKRHSGLYFSGVEYVIYTKIDTTQSPPIVVNVQVLNATDYMDPTFTWVDVTDMDPQPGLGYSYSNSLFSPGDNVITGTVDSTQVYLQTGSASTFAPFTITGNSARTYSYDVSIDGDILTIGCQEFGGLWARYCLYQILTLAQTQFQTMFVTPDNDIQWGSFIITNADCVSLLNALSTINFFS